MERLGLICDAAGLDGLGWDVYEGNATYERKALGPGRLVRPVAQYSHEHGCSITGGYVYRGTLQPAMRGTYLFGDYCSGRIWTLPSAGGLVPRQLAETGLRISSFGEGEDGEVYLVDVAGGGVYQVLAGG